MDSDDISPLETGYRPDQLERIIRNGWDIPSLPVTSSKEPNTFFVPLRQPVDGTTSRDLNSVNPDSILVTGVINSLKGDETCVETKVTNFFRQAKDSPAKIIIVPVQLKASWHFGALVRVNDDLLSFNPEGSKYNLPSSPPPNAQARFKEFIECETAAAHALGIDIWKASVERLQDPYNKDVQSCGVFVASFIFDVLAHSKEIIQVGFNFQEFVKPIGGYNERVVRAEHMAAMAGDHKGHLKTLHMNAAGRPQGRSVLYQSVSKL